MTTSARILRLLSLLQSHRFWPGDELAERLEVSIRTLRRDVDRLRELGYPVQARRGVDGGYQLAPGAVLPPLTVDDDEAVAIAVALLGAARNPVTGTADAALRALTKVLQVMPPPLRRRLQALCGATAQSPVPEPGPGMDAAVLTGLAQVCRDAERVGFDYVDAAGAATRRRVEPLRLVPVGSRWYLVAYDPDRADWRSFRLDRIARVRPEGGRFAPRRLPGGDAARFVRDGLRGAGRPAAVVAVADAPADRVRERIGQWADIEPDGPARCRVRVRAESLDWAAMALGVMGCEFRVEGPPEAVTWIREWSERFARATAAVYIDAAEHR